MEAGQARGYATEVIDHGLCSPLLAGAKSGLLLSGKPLGLPDVAIPRIGANMTIRGAALIRQLDAVGVPHTLDATALQLARDKMSCLQTLHTAGVAMPETALCFSVAEARTVARRMGPFPVVVKLLESTHGIGVALATSMYQLERVVEGFLQFQDRILLQEYIRESRGVDVRAFVVGGKIVAAMERRATGSEFRANIHRGATATALNPEELDTELILKAARTVGVEVAGVDLIPSRRGPLLMEINASPGLEGIEGVTKVDIAGAIVEYAAQKVKPV